MKRIVISLALLLLVVVSAVAASTYSREMYEKAVLGDAEAMYQLSLCFMNGKGVSADYDKSDYWLERAAEEGQPNAVAAIRAMLGKTGLSDAKRKELAAEEKRERERLEKELADNKAFKKGNNGNSAGSKTNGTMGKPSIGGGLGGYTPENFPTEPCPGFGTVIVKVVVSPTGKVTKASIVGGTLRSNAKACEICRSLAQRSTFHVPKNTAVERTGTLTYTIR